MENYLYIAADNAFYPVQLKELYEAAGSWPDQPGVVVSEPEFAKWQSPPPGKIRVAGADGLPAWANIPPPTDEEVKSAVHAKINALRVEADSIIGPLKDASEGGYIDDEDKPRLLAWQKYRYALTKVDPTNPSWPDKPA